MAGAKGRKKATSQRKTLRRTYRVFVSHAGDDIWLAQQIARRIEDTGATCFLDRRDIAAGDDFKVRIRAEMPKCDELLALFTPWSRDRKWVIHEMGMADVLGKRIVCVLYKVVLSDFDQDEGGRGLIDSLNTIELNGIEGYFEALRHRVGS